MREFSQKRKIRRILYSPLVLILLFVFLFFVARGSLGVYKKYSLSKDRLETSQEELGVLENKKDNIVNKIDRLQTETGIEKEIRSKFSVAREGEKVIVIVDDEVKEKVVEEEKTMMDNFFTTIKGWFQ